MRLLVELADTAAVRDCGRGGIQAALPAFEGGHEPDHALAMAGGEWRCACEG